MISNCGTFLVVDEASSFEFAEGVTKIEDKRRSILVPMVFLEINGKDVIMADGLGACFLWVGHFAMFGCTYLAPIEVINGVDSVVVLHLRLLH